jgi:peptidoglycan/xylan/chitin deacetylase (PgdA/CDA1 family)/GT2 family glycosyltransferase
MPDLSIVVPTHNRRDRLKALLASLNAQTAPLDSFEVIVVVDGSTDGTIEFLRDLDTALTLSIVEQQSRGVEAARNAGASRARGRYLLFLDDDLRADPSLVTEHLRIQSAEGGVVAIGRLGHLLPDQPSRWQRYRADEREFFFSQLADSRAEFSFCHGGNLCLPRQLFDDVSGFSTDMSVPGIERGFRYNDLELAFRLHERGARFVFAHEARAVEDDDETLTRFVADSRLRGASALALYERHPGMLPYLTLGRWGEASWKSCALRSVLLKLHVPAKTLGRSVDLLPSESLGRKWFHFVRIFAYWQGVRSVDLAMFERLKSGTTILMYHAVGNKKEDASRYVIPVNRLRQQWNLLKHLGYRVLSLHEYVACLLTAELPPRKCVVLTFDDGYRDNLELAVPMLEELDLPAAVFIVSASGVEALWNSSQELRGRRLLAGEEISAVARAASVGAHTRTHPRLTELTHGDVQREVVGSKEDLEQRLGSRVDIFCYPYGDYDESVRDQVEEAGFIAACTSVGRRNYPSTNPHELRRLEVRGTDSLLRFALTLLLGVGVRSRA